MAQKSSSDPPPSYNHTVYGESSSRPTDVYGPMVRGPDITYLKSPGGIVKIVQAVSMKSLDSIAISDCRKCLALTF